MEKLIVYVTRKIPQPGIDILEKVAKVIIGKTKLPPSKRDIIRNIKDCQGILCQLTDRIDSEIIASASNLKVITNYAVGIDNIDISTATKKKIMVTNTPGVLTETTADLAWALLMATARRIIEADQFTRKGKWKSWEAELLLGQDLHHATIGIIGMGRIGSEVARRAKGFSMKILYHNKNRNLTLEKELGARYVNLDELLCESDFISIHCPLTTDTYHLISEKELMKMKKTAILVNTSRGMVIDQKALHRTLKNKRIGGAGLDVFENEPINPKNPLLKLNNLVVTPHIGSSSVQTRTKMAIMAANDLVSVLKGKDPANWVNMF